MWPPAAPGHPARACPRLPADLRAALDRLAHGRSRNALAERAAAQSRGYRAGAGSRTITTDEDVLAYAFTRLPATYAAAAAALAQLRDTDEAFLPHTVLDVGAGPAAATFAAVQAFASVDEVCLIDSNERFRDFALRLMAEADRPALRDATYRHGDALALLGAAAARPVDLVIASYAAGEMPPRDRSRLAAALWAATAAVLVVIEPGTPAGYRRVLALRDAVIAAGGDVAAPCPHAGACPLSGADWCHFAQRLPRSRDHRAVKDVALPYEDEKFSYVALSRRPLRRRTNARLLAPPEVTKGAIMSKLCTAEGVVHEVAQRNDREAYRDRKNWRWGDGVVR